MGLSPYIITRSGFWKTAKALARWIGSALQQHPFNSSNRVPGTFDHGSKLLACAIESRTPVDQVVLVIDTDPARIVGSHLGRDFSVALFCGVLRQHDDYESANNLPK